MVAPFLLYGASGYTGQLIAAEAVRRGFCPVLAGRSANAIQPLAERLGCSFEVFSLDDRASLPRRLKNVPLLLNCAGPFSATAPAWLDACLQARAHYLDITGEIAVIELAARLADQAAAVGITLMPAVGFDVVPSDCLAAQVASRVPGANRLELAFTSLGRISPGTAKTMWESLPHGGQARIDGRIQTVPAAWKELAVPFRSGTKRCVTIPWGDVASAFYSTGIPNIETYTVVPQSQIRWLKRLRPLLPLFKARWFSALVARQIGRRVAGPSEQERATTGCSLWGRATADDGRSASATLETPNGYTLTVLTAVESAARVLAGNVAPGFQTPSRAFGPGYILEFPGCDLQWIEPPHAH